MDAPADDGLTEPGDEAARWARVRALLDGALEQPPDARAAWLAAACPDDDALRAEATALADAHDAAEASDALAGALRAAPAPAADRSGQHVGPWRLGPLLGRGGMGEVYRAERADGLYARTVALKLLHPGPDAGALARRLDAERQILARLAHPHVARLYDGGTAPDGTPYLALEYVEGEPITAYAERHRLDVRARLAVFLQVCEAVAYAHRNLVVHRDLKPSNVLVAEENGVPHAALLDFGIARLLDEGGGEGLTRTGLGPLTPAYAAPEQVLGHPVTTTTDVYALGVLLFELLAGQRPYALDGKTAREVERLVCEAEPPRPSAVAPAERARALRGDLDTIVAKALEKEPARRYASADALADDLKRHLDGQPVAARPATAGYRTRAFVRRHRVGVSAAALVALAVLGGAGAALWQAGRAREEARAARLEQDRATATLEFLQNTLYGAEPGQANPDATIREALDSAAAHVDRDLAEQPLVAAGVHSTVGYTYNSLGLYDRAERHQRRAAGLYARAGARYRREYGIELHNLAFTLEWQGRTEEALALYERALPIQRAHGAPGEYGSVLNSYAAVLNGLGRYDEAERHFREAIALWRREQHENLPLALSNLAVLYESTRRPREAVPLVEEAVRVLRAQGAGSEPELGTALGSLGTMLDYTGRSAEGAAALDEALALLRRVQGPDHPATLLNGAARALVDVRAGRPRTALPHARAAYEGVRRALPADHPYTPHVLSIYGQALCALGPDSARAGEPLTREALATRRALYSPEHFLVALAESMHGACLSALGRRDEALPLLTRGYAGLRTARGDADARTMDARRRLEAARR